MIGLFSERKNQSGKTPEYKKKILREHRFDVERPALVASEYLDQVERNETVLIVTPSWKEHSLLTDQVREKLRKKGLIESNDTYLDGISLKKVRFYGTLVNLYSRNVVLVPAE